MLYARSHTFWDGKVSNLSNEYFLELIDYLQDKRKIMSFSGFTCKESNVSSMLLVLPEFIDECNGYSKDLLMDNCLRQPEQTLCEIRVKKGKDSYKVIKPSEEDLPVFQEAVNILTQLGDMYTESRIEIGNKLIPEYFLHRVYLDNVNCCGRFFDKGEIQGSSKALRSTITIDGEDTVELDFKNLHYAFAAEELGLDLKGTDPYDFEFNIDADYSEIDDFKQQYSITKYNPIRNLKKTALLVMINAKDKKSAISGISNEIFKDKCKKDQSTRKYVGINKVPVTDLVNAVIEHNQCISKYLNSGAGVRFQNLDSRIIEYCIKEFIKIRQVFLPVHDSLIVKESLADFTKKCMIDGYEYVMGSKINCIVE
jgi:hypothetical protein